MRHITMIGTGYVGLVTGVCLAEIGHHVTCVDIDQQKVEKMRAGISPIYEPGMEALMKNNLNEGRLSFTTNMSHACEQAHVIYIAVGTPQRSDGTVDLTYIKDAAQKIGQSIRKNVIVVTKSTVPVGTNQWIKETIQRHLKASCEVEIVANPEFLREGSAIEDTFHGDRIVLGADNNQAAAIIEEINQPFDIPIYKTDLQSAEMIKYASNAFLATKISFINEIASICEKVGANVDDVAHGMGMDNRIGPKFLQAGIGYGGSCFPKDTEALVQIAGNVEHHFDLLKAVIRVNNEQQVRIIEKAKQALGEILAGKTIAILGLAFKPNTDDIREAASIVIAKQLVKEGAVVNVYDPVAMENAKSVLADTVNYKKTVAAALERADGAIIVTEWDEIKRIPLKLFSEQMNTPIIIDGRNCYSLKAAEAANIEYHSIGRKSIFPEGTN